MTIITTASWIKVDVCDIYNFTAEAQRTTQRVDGCLNLSFYKIDRMGQDNSTAGLKGSLFFLPQRHRDTEGRYITRCLTLETLQVIQKKPRLIVSHLSVKLLTSAFSESLADATTFLLFAKSCGFLPAAAFVFLKRQLSVSLCLCGEKKGLSLSLVVELSCPILSIL